MNSLNGFFSNAKGLARNPLGIIALFIVLIYGFAALTVGASTHLQSMERLPIIWFLVLFPVVVLGVFAWLVSSHHEKLYAPADYQDDKSFLDGVARARQGRTAEVAHQQDVLKDRVQDIVKGFLGEAATRNDKTSEQALENTMTRIEDEIDRLTSITIDAREFLGSNDATYKLPVAAFESFGELTDEVYFKLKGAVSPFRYGVEWVLARTDKNEIIRNARMIMRAKPGAPFEDPRSLSEVGIKPGDTLIVKKAFNF